MPCYLIYSSAKAYRQNKVNQTVLNARNTSVTKNILEGGRVGYLHLRQNSSWGPFGNVLQNLF